MNYRNILIDIGNSRMKILLDSKYFYFSYQETDYLEFTNFISKYSENYRIFYSSVNLIAQTKLLKIFQKFQISAINIKEILCMQEIIDISEVKGAGSDRILGLIGASEINNKTFSTIDFGSATTINFVKENRFIGGSILAGGKTLLKALGNISKKLDFKEIIDWQGIFGKDTRSAINNGIYLATIGGIEFALDKINSIDNEITKSIFVTGGLSTIFYPKLNPKHNIIHRPNLVIEGMEKILKQYL